MGWSPSDGEQSCGANAALRAQAECGGCSLDQGELREGERTGVLRGDLVRASTREVIQEQGHD